MGSHLLSAEIGRSSGGRAPAKPNYASVERPLGGFSEYLAEARSARKSARPVDKPARASDQAQGDADDKRADSARDTSPHAAVPQEEAGGQTEPVPVAAPAETGVAKPAEGAEVGGEALAAQVEQTTTAPPGGAVKITPQVPSEAPAASISGDETTPPASCQANEAGPVTDTASVSPQPTAVTPTRVPAFGETPAIPTSAAVPKQAGSTPPSTALEDGTMAAAPVKAPPEAPQNENAAVSSQSKAAAAADAAEVVELPTLSPARESRTDQPEREARQPQPMRREEASTQVSSAQSGRLETRGSSAQPETVQQIKVRESTEARREGSAGGGGESGPSRDASTNHNAERAESTAQLHSALGRGGKSVSSGPSVSGGVDDSGVTLTATTAAAEVDGAAAAGRVAAPTASISDAGGRGAASSHGLTAGAAVPATTAQGSGTVEATGTLVGQFLANELTGPDGPASGARVLHATAGAGRYQLALQLEPPDLGQLRLNIQVQQQVMTLQVQVESRTTARLIDSRMSELRDALAVHGIRVERTDVIVQSPASQDTGLYRHNGEEGAGAGRFAAGQEGGGASGEGHSGGAQDQGEGGGYGPSPTVEGWEPASEGDWTSRQTLEHVAATELSLDLVA